ncbi:hypothetical protein N7509_012940 [Penicillium cosmopolitanum]|uniref:Uncharacterized protein n=1 Tax=Penicillium cosmopolitanum TaxID=1131564 RepID=A0A9W9SF42_9EURO|nr:uncharacterized protein N7509_012940 [Penicillium cosmopolitanum]KAJ5376054.1 hypothetical protein N7509_012940 [Penicillium cosmopolitanum]
MNPTWSSNSDITGIGVVANFVGTSLIAVLVIIVYYFATYQPTCDPFEEIGNDSLPSQPQHSFRPNPVDVLVLTFIRHHFKMKFSARTQSRHSISRFETSFIKVISAQGPGI